MELTKAFVALIEDEEFELGFARGAFDEFV